MYRICLFISVLSLLIGISGCSFFTENEKKKSGDRQEFFDSNETGPLIEFASTEHNFGRVHEGEKVGWYFKYKNAGDSDLIITRSFASCGCTVPDYSREPLPPGKEGFIRVVFDTSGRSGIQTKNITIESNAQNNVITLKVIAEVY